MSDARLSTIILVCAAIGVGTYLTGSAENIWRKVKLTGIGAVHMLLSKDKKFKPQVRARVPALAGFILGVSVCLQMWKRTCFTIVLPSTGAPYKGTQQSSRLVL